MNSTTQLIINLNECEKLMSAVKVLGESEQSDIGLLKIILKKLENSHTDLTMHAAFKARWEPKVKR